MKQRRKTSRWSLPIWWKIAGHGKSVACWLSWTEGNWMIPGSACLIYKVSVWWAVGWLVKAGIEQQRFAGLFMIHSWRDLEMSFQERMTCQSRCCQCIPKENILKDWASLTYSQLRRVKRDFDYNEFSLDTLLTSFDFDLLLSWP